MTLLDRLFDLILLHFIAQRIAVDAEQFGRTGLITPGSLHYQFDQGFFHAAYHHFVDGMRLFAVEIVKVIFDGFAYAPRNIVFVDYAHATNSSASTYVSRLP